MSIGNKMKQTFTTVMPDRIGAFLEASRVFAALGLNITRVSYNKAVDVHTLFIEAEGSAQKLEEAAEKLRQIGCLVDSPKDASVIVMEFRLRDEPGTLTPVLELINEFRFNISYISAQENGTPYQAFRMGLFVEDERGVSRFLHKASLLCDVQIIDYDPSSTMLDNTVFYLSFARRIASMLSLSKKDEQRLIIDSNLIMEMLTQRSSPTYKTFDYIGKFAEALHAYHGDAYRPRVSRHALPGGLEAILIEPPCGSNTCLIQTKDGVLCVDGGFPCYQKELLETIRGLIPDFDSQPTHLLLTHADVDHCGLNDRVDAVSLSQKCFTNFENESKGLDNLREENPVHAPYVRISKILSDYRGYDTSSMQVIGGDNLPLAEPLKRIGLVRFGSLNFETYEAAGGHVAGETVYVERRLKIVFTGDIYVNIKGFTRQQAAFNRLAPFLMTSVDTDPALAAQERAQLHAILGGGDWLIFGGHGNIVPFEIGDNPSRIR